MNSKVVTIQQTGKLFKAMQSIGILLVLIGFPLIFFSSIGSESSVQGITGFVFIVFGPVLYIAGRAGAWWWHG